MSAPLTRYTRRCSWSIRRDIVPGGKLCQQLRLADAPIVRAGDVVYQPVIRFRIFRSVGGQQACQ